MNEIDCGYFIPNYYGINLTDFSRKLKIWVNLEIIHYLCSIVFQLNQPQYERTCIGAYFYRRH